MAAKIMCVDDSSTIRMLVKKSLEPAGYEVLEAENGKEGLDKSGSGGIGMFIVDVNMPVMNGFEFVGEIKKQGAHASTPIVFLTTESSAEKKEMGKNLGVQGWIVKPFEPEPLLKIVKMLLG
jgi:two-component system, chemotaxis family, chemotaxis protein CheY